MLEFAGASMKKPASVARKKPVAADVPLTTFDPSWPGALRDSVQREIARWGCSLTKRGSAFGVSCPLCVKVAPSKRGLLAHFERFHRHTANGMLSTKQKRLVEADWEARQLRRMAWKLLRPDDDLVEEDNYLSRATETLRSQLALSPSWGEQQHKIQRNLARFDKNIRLLLDVDCSRFVLLTDSHKYHRVSRQYYSTTAFLHSVLAAAVHPDTKSSLRRVAAHLEERCGTLVNLLPKQLGGLVRSLLELVLALPEVEAIRAAVRRRADKRVLAIDGTYKTLLSVKHQTKHGAKKNQYDDSNALRCMLTVRCPSAILLTQPKYDEDFVHQLAALDEAVGDHGSSEVLAVFSDAPDKLDKCDLYKKFTRVVCVLKDTLHVALRVCISYKFLAIFSKSY